MANHDDGLGLAESADSDFAMVSAAFEDEVAAGKAAHHLRQAGVDELDVSRVTVAGGVRPAAVKVTAATTRAGCRGVERILLGLGGSNVYSIIATPPQSGEKPDWLQTGLLLPEADVLEQSEPAVPTFAERTRFETTAGASAEADVLEQNTPVAGYTLLDERESGPRRHTEPVPEADEAEQLIPIQPDLADTERAG